MIVRIEYKGKKIVVKNVMKCQSFYSKLRGLMFRKDLNPLLFIFKRPTRMSIHSFFVKRKFLAIWSLKNKVIDVKIIEPYTLSVRPKKEFDMLLEIPFESNEEISRFLDGSEKHLKTLFG